MLQSGSGLPPGFPLQGQGCGRRTAGRSACPVVRATGTPLHFPSPGKSRLYPYSSFPPQRPFAFAGTPFIGLGIKVPQKPPPNRGLRRLFLPCGVTTLPLSKKSKNPPLRLQLWLTGAEYGRGQGCNNAMTSGCSLLYGYKFAILKNAAGTLCNVATFMLPFSSTSGFRSCGSGCLGFSFSLHSQCVRRSRVPGLF